MKELRAQAFGPEAGGAGAVGSTPVLCLKGFPLWGETTKESVEKADFGLVGSSGCDRGVGGDREGSNAALVEGSNKAMCDGGGGVGLFKPGL